MSDRTPLVSVVMPTYNRASLLGESLDSVFRQTYPRLEVIVVDDGSEDATEAALMPWRDRITYIRQPNRGLSAARSAGMRSCHGDYVAWIDSDDLWEPEKTALQVAFMERHPDIALVSTDFLGFDENGPIHHSDLRAYYSAIRRHPGGLRSLYPDPCPVEAHSVPWLGGGRHDAVLAWAGHVYDHLMFGNFIHPPTVMLRRSAVEAAGGLDADLRYAGDFDYFIRVARLGRLGLIDRRCVRYRHSDSQLSGDRHLVPTRIDILRITEKAAQRDPEWVQRNRTRFRTRLGSCHVALALALARTQPGAAVRHVGRALALGHVETGTLRTLTRATLPGPVLGFLRRVRGRSFEAGMAATILLQYADDVDLLGLM